MEYKKSYKGLVIWMVLFIVFLFGCAFVPTEDTNFMTLLVDNVMTIGMAILTWIIYKNEKIYWYTGLSYEDAKQAGSKQRKKYAMQHFKRFGIFAGIYLAYSIMAYLFIMPIGLSITIALFGLVGVAISTMNIKLDTECQNFSDKL
ncbi:MAG: hypothetical protein PUF12_04025 [Thermoflexaceae bacterium]|nr:hypothetical protein [Thermoflexaceae bacterium]